MTAEWMLTDAEMKDILPTGFDPEPCDRDMCKAQVKKLLEYLIAEKMYYFHSERVVSAAELDFMLKQLEAK